MTATATRIDMPLQPKQEHLLRLFLQSGPEAPTILGFGGSRGGAKSGSIRRIAVPLANLSPGSPIWIVRRVYDDLKRNHIDSLFEEFPELEEYYRASSRELVFDNGSRIQFLYAETRDDVIRKFRGPQAKYIFVDQAEQFSEEELQRIKSANRHPGSKPGDCKLGLFFNPGGPGTEYLRRIFYLRQYLNEERPGDYDFIQAYGWDNFEWFRGLGISPNDFYALSSDQRFDLFIQETDYGRALNALPDHLRVGELLGSFEQFAGQYFAGVWNDRCIIDRKQAKEIIQPWWTRWMAQDWGFGDHTCHIWFATGKLSPEEWVRHFGGETDWPMDVVIAYREYVVNERAEADLATDIVSMTPEAERNRITRFFLSSDAFGQKARQQGAHSVGEQFARILGRHGLPSPEPADQDRVIGWRFLYNSFRQANLRGAKFDQERSKQGPALFVSSDCARILSSVPLAIRETVMDPNGDPDDVARVAGAVWEDVTDACRYGMQSMLGPRSKPREVRAQETYHQYDGNPTAQAMAMRIFNEQEKTRSVISRRPRWRDSGV